MRLLRVEAIQTEHGERYVLLNNDGDLVYPVLKFLKFKDNIGSSRNTLRRLCFNLKLFFEFLEQIESSYELVDLGVMADCIAWLKKPIGAKHVKVSHIPTVPTGKMGSPKTINYIIDDVLRFYEYFNRHEEFSNHLNDQLKKTIHSKSGFKRFLHHLNSKKTLTISTSILKLPVPKEKPKTLTKQQIEILFDACNNARDRFLLYLLYETGIRIGEALALQLIDIDHARGKIHIRDRGILENKSEIKTVGSVRVIDCSRELTNLYSSYLLEIHDNERVDTNFVFIKLSGPDQFQPMDYGTVNGLFNTLKRKTGINVTPHMYRHTSLTELAKQGIRMEVLQKRAGHKHVQTTIDTYTHFDEEDIRTEWKRVTSGRKTSSTC